MPGAHDLETLFEATFQNAAVGIAHVAPNGQWLRVNRKLCEIVGYSEDELTRTTFQDITYADDVEPDMRLFEPLMRGELEGDGYRMEKRYHRKDKEIVWIHLTTALQRTDDGAPLFCISVVEDITERKRLEAERDETLAHLHRVSMELNHRVKNTLAVVQAIAARSFSDERDVAEGRSEFISRLQALAATHDLLLEDRWVKAPLSGVVDAALAPMTDKRCVLGGPDATLETRPAINIAMALGELATNAIKHGALSVPDGEIAVSWNIDRVGDGHCCTLTWTERGGPAVDAPRPGGFGLVLIDHLLKPDGKAEVEFAAEGVVARLTFPVIDG